MRAREKDKIVRREPEAHREREREREMRRRRTWFFRRILFLACLWAFSFALVFCSLHLCVLCSSCSSEQISMQTFPSMLILKLPLLTSSACCSCPTAGGYYFSLSQVGTFFFFLSFGSPKLQLFVLFTNKLFLRRRSLRSL